MSAATQVINSANDLLTAHRALVSQVRVSQQQHRRRLRTLQPKPDQLVDLNLIPSPSPSPPLSPALPIPPSTPKPLRPDLPPAKRARIAKYHHYVPEEETIRNDYSQRYVDGGEWPQNWVLGAELERRFEEYPKQQRLLNLKRVSVANHALPSSYLPLSSLPSLLPCKFDVILLDPPFSSSFTWDTLQDLPIPALAADPSFIFMWVGSGAGEGLERGREVLAKWGYRRCEDVVWVKTNRDTNRGPGTDAPTTSLLTRTKQHCLIGIRGTVRRSTDSWFVHCNVDTDVIVWEGDSFDPTRKPPEMYTLIENFCLGTRRLEIFGKFPSSLRNGWITVLADGEAVGESHTDEERIMRLQGGASRWRKETWESGIKELANGGKFVVPMTSDIDALRPKSPFRPGVVGAGASGSGGTPMAVGSRGGHFGDGSQGVFRNSGSHHQGSLAQSQNQMMVQPMVGMGMNMLGGMGNVALGVDGMLPGLTDWSGMMGLGSVGGMGTAAGGIVGMGQMEQLGMGGFSGAHMQGLGLGWPSLGAEVQLQHQFMERQGVWDGVDGMVGMGGMPINGGAMNGMAGINHMGVGMDQWSAGQYNRY